ncbi:hypothetical protein [Rufibacter roseus]|uniref:Collagen-like protein n=1 Tax=Rufibacter roseus TaxID=1567108 RepID=A0ABW2DPH4_9BACT|nr:hypothetical protein [Rufibacter roseus]
MRLPKSIFLLVSLLFIANNVVQAQLKSKTLVIKKKDLFVVGPTNSLILDTLIMEDKSTLRFWPHGKGILIVKHAFIGKNCLISSKGSTRFHGEDGGPLSLTIEFKELESLTIDASGGDGKNGTHGTNGSDGVPDREERYYVIENNVRVLKTRFIPGRPATSGTPGTMGGVGGSGGDVSLTYSTTDFIINFNNTKGNHVVVIKNSAGRLGVPGRNGTSGTAYGRGMVDNIGSGNPNAKAGKITDGKITLNNMAETTL